MGFGPQFKVVRDLVGEIQQRSINVCDTKILDSLQWLWVLTLIALPSAHSLSVYGALHLWRSLWTNCLRQRLGPCHVLRIAVTLLTTLQRPIDICLKLWVVARKAWQMEMMFRPGHMFDHHSSAAYHTYDGGWTRASPLPKSVDRASCKGQNCFVLSIVLIVWLRPSKQNSRGFIDSGLQSGMVHAPFFDWGAMHR